jgi:hypothetical protein
MPLIRFLDTNGDGTGTKNAVGNYAASATNFYIQPPVGTSYVLTQFYIQLSDAGAFGQSVYGSLAAALTNGLQIKGYRGANITLDLTDGLPIKINDHFTHLSDSVNVINWAGGVNTLTCSFDSHTFGTPFILNGNYADRLQVICNDDFTLLVDQTFLVRGFTL